MENKELFEDYEISGWRISPKTYKFLGAAAGLHLFALIIIGQFNLLQTKACDSPYVGKVCQILDVVSLGADLAGTDMSAEDRDYNKTVIEEGDITYIDVSGQAPPFTYPEGYFAVANPPDQMGQLPMTDFGTNFPPNNGISTSPSTLSPETPQVLPTPNNNVANQPIPDSPFDFGDQVKPAPVARQPRIPSYPNYPARQQTKRPPIRTTSPSKLPKLPGEDEVAGNSNSGKSNANSNSSSTVAQNGNNANSNASNQAVADDNNGKWNSKPLKDFGDKYGNKILKKEVDINAPFTIEVIGQLDSNGKITNAKMQSSPGSDPKMTEVATEAIAAFGDTNLLKPLYDVVESNDKNKNKVVNIKITFSQNKDNLQAIIQTETKSETDAKRIQSGLNLVIKGSTAFMRQDSDEAKLMSKAELATQGKIFIINFLLANDEKTQLIEKSLKGLEEKKTQQPNSVASTNKDANAK